MCWKFNIQFEWNTIVDIYVFLTLMCNKERELYIYLSNLLSLASSVHTKRTAWTPGKKVLPIWSFNTRALKEITACRWIGWCIIPPVRYRLVEFHVPTVVDLLTHLPSHDRVTHARVHASIFGGATFYSWKEASRLWISRAWWIVGGMHVPDRYCCTVSDIIQAFRSSYTGLRCYY